MLDDRGAEGPDLWSGDRLGGGAAYIPAQIGGAITGAVLANPMFDLPAVQISTTERTGTQSHRPRGLSRH